MNLHKRHYSAQADLSVVVRQHPRERPCTNLPVPEILAENFMNNGSRSFREFLLKFVKSQASNLLNFPSFFSQVLSHANWDSTSLKVITFHHQAFDATLSHSTQLSNNHHFLLSIKVNSANILCFQKKNYS